MIGFIKISPTRLKTPKILESEFKCLLKYLKNRTQNNPSFQYTSGFEIQKLVMCLNEEASKGSFYTDTQIRLKGSGNN